MRFSKTLTPKRSSDMKPVQASSFLVGSHKNAFRQGSIIFHTLYTSKFAVGHIIRVLDKLFFRCKQDLENTVT
jgi:hypothetical protein